MWVRKLTRLFVSSPNNQLEAAITQIISEFTKKPPSQISPSANFRTDLGLTSLDHLELLMILESKFNIEVEDNKEAELVKSVQSAVEFVRRKQGS